MIEAADVVVLGLGPAGASAAAAGLANPVTGAGIAAAVHSGRLAGQAAAGADAQAYQEELEDLYGAALERASRRSWIAYPEYWQ